MHVDGWTFGFGLVLASAAFAHEGSPSRFNYRDHVRPIFVEHCAGCHRPGGVAPMSLLEYSEAVPWAKAMKMQVLEQRMPPWLPAEGTGSFRHTRSLSAEEIDILIDWAVGLTPEGGPLTSDETVTESRDGWSLGEPDLLLAPKTGILIGEDEYEATRCVVVPTELAGPRLASAFELRPGLPNVVRRATVYLAATCGSDSRPLVTWLPGQGSAGFAADLGVVLTPSSSLAVELLYVKGWNEEGLALEDKSELGVWWNDDARPVQSLRVTEPRHRFSHDVELVALYPEPTGESDEPLRVETVSPDGVVRPLLVIERYEGQWREKYVLIEPLVLPSGSELKLYQTSVWIDFMAASATPAD